ncbi:MAG: hypothetical protein RLZZ628_1588 [Bacteroidota bacterium]|jgi:hypothetical protein
MIIKNKKSIGLAFVAAALLGLNACKSYFGDVNVDPHAPLDASPAAILLAAETRLVYTIGGDFARYASVFTQHVDGYDRQFAGYQNYTFVPADFNTPWDNLYAGVLIDLKSLVAKADASGYNAYGGVARALQAHTLMMIADYYGDAPYSAALDATKTFQPAYDKQSALYTTIFTLLNDARTKLAAAPGVLKPGATDIIYGGSAAKWTKYCNVLAARAYLHLGKLDAANYGKALAELAKGGFASGADDARFAFAGNGVGDAPWYQFNTNRGDIATGARYKAMLTALKDPRMASYGADLDDAHPIFTQTQAVSLATFTEQKFIEAECKLKLATPDTAAARAAMLAGIQASFTEAGVDAAAYAPYIAQSAVVPQGAPVTLQGVMIQKYLALYTDPEAYNDWRRTNIPALTPNLGTFVPRRFLYPQTELDLNSNTPKTTKLSDRVGWDIQ